MTIDTIEYKDLAEYHQKVVEGLIEKLGVMVMGGDTAKAVLNNMTIAYIKHKLIFICHTLPITTVNLTKNQMDRYNEIMKIVLTDEAYEQKIKWSD